jgi:hypothetical protein
MKVTEIRIDELKPTGSFLNSRMGVTISISEDHEIDKAFALGKQIIDETHKKNFPFMYENGNPIYRGEENLPVKQARGPLDQFEEDFKFNDVKKRLAEFEFREDAQAYIETTEYRYTVEAKKIIEAKPIKNK